ncbi:MAG: FYVE domain [Lasallia pustulata]|uniref:FYVE domain n=1 Tax=Lasallia pustulata TaxID=136370 RepID=A0A5M8PCA5_9LECA|nr:MAG: FYVE domain [Lasallia pustulata]
MATGIPTAQMYTTPPGSQTQLFGAQQLSPSNSTSGTPTAASPTSPQSSTMYPDLPLHTKQLRPLKSPMYVPAVLRPTERPPRQTITPPRSVRGSLDSLDGIAHTLSGRSTGDGKNKEGSDDDSEEEVVEHINLPEVTGPPTKEHWKPDADAVICDAPICPKSFSLFERRHHCRRCGYVFCNNHSHFMIPLDQDAEFHPDGTLSRACKHCWNLYCSWEVARRSRSNSTSSGATTTPVMPMLGSAKAGPLNPEATKATVSSSIPRDWNWSTF